MSNYQPLLDSEWEQIAPLFPNPVKRTRGKPHTAWRSVVNSILYVLLTGQKWASLPKDVVFATKSAAHRWFVTWEKNGLLRQLVEAYEKTKGMSATVITPHRRNRLPKVKEAPVLETVAAI